MGSGGHHRFSVLIIGCGAIAGGYDQNDRDGPKILTHAKAFNLHPGFEVRGCVDMDVDKATEFSKFWSIPQAYSTLGEALADQDYDIICLCSSTASHQACLQEIQDRPFKLVFCEKPITDNIISSREMAGLFQDKMVVNYLRRFDPALITLAQEIKSGKYGELLSAKAHYNKGLYNNGSHMIDLLQMFFGDLKVISAGRPVHDFWPQDATLDGILCTKTGARVSLEGGDVRQGMRFDLYVTLEKAHLAVENFSDKISVKYNNGHTESRQTSLDTGMQQAVLNIYEHLVKATQLLSTAQNGLQALEICSDLRKNAGMEG